MRPNADVTHVGPVDVTHVPPVRAIHVIHAQVAPHPTAVNVSFPDLRAQIHVLQSVAAIPVRPNADATRVLQNVAAIPALRNGVATLAPPSAPVTRVLQNADVTHVPPVRAILARQSVVAILVVPTHAALVALPQPSS